jgi:uncharacterized membrane protein YeaQ/YmgE (transglycosylase-associated protein family)
MELLAPLLAWLILCFVCGAIGGMCAENRGRGPAGFLLGFLLGPLGIVLALFLPEDRKAIEAGKPGRPVKRVRPEYKKRDPIEEFEERERAKKAFEEVPEHLRGKPWMPVVVPLRRAKKEEDE